MLCFHSRSNKATESFLIYVSCWLHKNANCLIHFDSIILLTPQLSTLITKDLFIWFPLSSLVFWTCITFSYSSSLCCRESWCDCWRKYLFDKQDRNEWSYSWDVWYFEEVRGRLSSLRVVLAIVYFKFGETKTPKYVKQCGKCF